MYTQPFRRIPGHDQTDARNQAGRYRPDLFFYLGHIEKRDFLGQPLQSAQLDRRLTLFEVRRLSNYSYPTGNLAPWNGPSTSSKDLEKLRISSSDWVSKSMGLLKPCFTTYPVLK